MTKPMPKRRFNLDSERARLAPHGIALSANPVECVAVLGDEVLRLRAELRAMGDQGTPTKSKRKRITVDQVSEPMTTTIQPEDGWHYS